jgi:hypothetical protein
MGNGTTTLENSFSVPYEVQNTPMDYSAVPKRTDNYVYTHTHTHTHTLHTSDQMLIKLQRKKPEKNLNIHELDNG